MPKGYLELGDDFEGNIDGCTLFDRLRKDEFKGKYAQTQLIPHPAQRHQGLAQFYEELEGYYAYMIAPDDVEGKQREQVGRELIRREILANTLEGRIGNIERELGSLKEQYGKLRPEEN